VLAHDQKGGEMNSDYDTEFLIAAKKVIDKVRPYSMVPDENLLKTMHLAVQSIINKQDGSLVECGTWMGGSSFAMLLIQQELFGNIVKPVWMFDSFQGLPDADERDGPMAIEYQKNKDEPGYLDNCTAPLDKVRDAIAGFGFTDDEAIVVPGWFNDTVPLHKQRLVSEKISVLRIDCDWYEPVFFVLNELALSVVDEGAIILDDYYAWDGCALATHDYLSSKKLSWRIRSMDKFYGAWMINRTHRKDVL